MGRIKISTRWLRFTSIFNNCPHCSKGKVFEGWISLNNHCKECNINFKIYNVGDGAAWITTFILSIVSLPLAFFLDYTLKISLTKLVFFMTIIILLLSIVLLRISRYLLIKKMIDLEYNEKK